MDYFIKSHSSLLLQLTY